MCKTVIKPQIDRGHRKVIRSTPLRQSPIAWQSGADSTDNGAVSQTYVTLTPHPFLVPWSRKSRAISLPLPPIWAVRPVQSLSAFTRVHFAYLLSQTYGWQLILYIFKELTGIQLARKDCPPSIRYRVYKSTPLTPMFHLTYFFDMCMS
jgi:hypothetical protein